MALFQPPITQPFMGARQPLEGRKGPPSTLLVPNPPFIESGRNWQELAPRLAYVAPPPNPVQGKRLTPSLLVVPDPPFATGIRDPRDLYARLGRWIQPQPLPYMPRYVPPITVVAADYVPYTRPWLWSVLQTYLPIIQPAIQRELSPGIPGQSVDNPPTTVRNLFWTTVQAPYSIFPQRQMSPGIPGMSVDNPPLLRAQPHILQQWQPAIIYPPHPTWLVPPPVIAQIDNPPFGIPPKWLYSVLDTHVPFNPAGRILKPGQIVQEGPPVVVVPVTTEYIIFARHRGRR